MNEITSVDSSIDQNEISTSDKNDFAIERRLSKLSNVEKSNSFSKSYTKFTEKNSNEEENENTKPGEGLEADVEKDGEGETSILSENSLDDELNLPGDSTENVNTAKIEEPIELFKENELDGNVFIEKTTKSQNNLAPDLPNSPEAPKSPRAASSLSNLEAKTEEALKTPEAPKSPRAASSLSNLEAKTEEALKTPEAPKSPKNIPNVTD
jgi:hypothetical protein